MNNSKIKIGKVELSQSPITGIFDVSLLEHGSILIKDIPLNCSLKIMDTDWDYISVQINKIKESCATVMVTLSLEYEEWDHVFSLNKYAEILPGLFLKHKKQNPVILSSTFNGKIFQFQATIDITKETIEDVIDEFSIIWEGINDSFEVCLNMLFNNIPDNMTSKAKELKLGDLELRSKDGRNFEISKLELKNISLDQLPVGVNLVIVPVDISGNNYTITKGFDRCALVTVHQIVLKNRWKSTFSVQQYSILKEHLIISEPWNCSPVVYYNYEEEYFNLNYAILIEGTELDKIYLKAIEMAKALEEKMLLYENAADEYFSNLVKEK